MGMVTGNSGTTITGQKITAGMIGNSRGTSGTEFFAGGDDALAALIKALAGNGTAEQQASRANRQTEINQVREDRAGFSKEQAKIDATAAVEAQQRQALEQLLPSINNAARGAGTSQSSMRALLLQDAAQKASDSAALLGLQNVKDYGAITSNLSSVLEALTRTDNPQTAALLEALSISKGTRAESATSLNGNQGVVGYGGVVYANQQQKDAANGKLYATPGQSNGPSKAYQTSNRVSPLSLEYQVANPTPNIIGIDDLAALTNNSLRANPLFPTSMTRM